MRFFYITSINSNLVMTLAVAFVAGALFVNSTNAAKPVDAKSVAKQVDRLIEKEVRDSKARVAPRTSDEDFLRRITFDLAGTTPSPREVTLFGLSPSSNKRSKQIEKLLASDEYATNWARYWRDVIFTRATNMRVLQVQRPFEEWMTEHLKSNSGWDEIATEIVTATGDIRDSGETALIFAQEGQASEIAAETSRIFLGIQLQCANCHDHPWDSWKRDQFHELTAFFPRIGLRPIREEMRTVSYEVVSVDQQRRRRGGQLLENAERLIRLLDRNRDGKVTKAEAARAPQFARIFDRILPAADKNGDKALSLSELKKAPSPMPNRPGRGASEHFMPDLDNPTSEGTQMNPKFFVTGQKARTSMTDIERRTVLSRYLTATNNEWFAKAFVNRIWGEMLGEGFYMPIDDIGPERSASYPEVLELLSNGFAASGYDIKWLFRTIANTETYQREIRAADPTGATPPFASATPTRLRADQLYTAIFKVLGIDESQVRGAGGQMNYRSRRRSPRFGFNQIFGFDPSTPQEDLLGNVPQALFMMNSPGINSLIRANGRTKLAQIIRKYDDDEDAINELYLQVLAREPSSKEMQITTGYIKNVGDRGEAYEDLLWSLLNSSEFISKR